MAVSAGMKINIPCWMEVIGLGVKELTMTTHAAITDALSLPATRWALSPYAHGSCIPVRTAEQHHEDAPQRDH